MLNAAIETGGGLEALPNALKKGSTGPATAWAKSALTEGLEEPVQSALSGAAEKLFFDKDKPTVSLSDRNAVINPGRMAEEFAKGAAVGGILGAGQLVGNRLAAADPMARARQGDYFGLIQKLDQLTHQKKLKELEVAYKKNVVQDAQPQIKESEAAELHEFNDQSEYLEWLTSIGAEGSELDTLEKYSTAKYNNSPEYMMLERYATDVETGWISPLSGFENYQTLNRKIETEIVGATTANGFAINGYVPHFMQRVIGTTVDPKILKENLQIIRRSGVDVDEIKDAVFSPEKIGDVTVRKTGHKSIKFIGKNCVVTINPDTGELIQTVRAGQKAPSGGADGNLDQIRLQEGSACTLTNNEWQQLICTLSTATELPQ